MKRYTTHTTHSLSLHHSAITFVLKISTIITDNCCFCCCCRVFFTYFYIKLFPLHTRRVVIKMWTKILLQQFHYSLLWNLNNNNNSLNMYKAYFFFRLSYTSDSVLHCSLHQHTYFISFYTKKRYKQIYI